MKRFSSLILVVFAVVLLSSLGVKNASANTLVNASGSLTTSRPSPSSPLNPTTDPLAIGGAGVRVVDNLSTFLASDAAKFYNKGVYSESVTIATTSADKLTAFFTTATTVAHDKTSVLVVPITAMHTFRFTTSTAVPVGGKIIITYPTSAAADTVQASASANTWMFNNLSSSTDVQMKPSAGTSTCSWAISGATNGSGSQTPTLTCTVATATIPGGTVINIYVGCTAATAASCTTQKPLLINPTNSNARGAASIKSVTIATQDSVSNLLDNTTIKIGNIESVFVVAHVDPTFTFNIDGVAASTDMHTVSTCGTSYAAISTNSSFDSTGTEVNLGTITAGGNTYAAQKMTITSNTANGYALTATTSGFLINPGQGVYIVNAQGNATANDTPVPAVISTGGTGGYGINACDANSRVNTTTWGQASPKFANPSPTFYYTLVNYSGSLSTSGDTIYSVYGARAGNTTPPGDYWQVITYTASVTF